MRLHCSRKKRKKKSTAYTIFRGRSRVCTHDHAQYGIYLFSIDVASQPCGDGAILRVLTGQAKFHKYGIPALLHCYTKQSCHGFIGRGGVKAELWLFVALASFLGFRYLTETLLGLEIFLQKEVKSDVTQYRDFPSPRKKKRAQHTHYFKTEEETSIHPHIALVFTSVDTKH